MEFKNLEYGSTGSDVQLLQQMLKLLYLFPGTITGSYGPETKEAVMSFQARYNLPITGIVDQNTWDELVSVNQILERYENNSRIDLPTLRLGSTGAQVESLQTQLNNLTYYDGPINGIFNVTTENAVKAFQSNNKLIADGIVGRNTWNALTYLYSPLAICEDDVSTEVYTVQRGDTLYSIARRFNTTVAELKKINNLVGDNLSIGQQLIIRKQETPDIPGQTYVVKQGDTLYSIARRFNTTVDEIKRINNLSNNMLQIGQVLNISEAEDETPISPGQTYVVQQGDTLYSIARRFNITVDEIKRINNLKSDGLQIGQQLNITQTDDVQQTYTVVSGDTLYSIARRFNTNVENLKNKNNLTSNTISIGQILMI